MCTRNCIVPDAAKLINHPLEAPALLWSNVGDRLTHMDKSGIDVEALRQPLGTAPSATREQLIQSAKRERWSSSVPVHPDRFVGFATAALQFRTSLRKQVEHAVKKLGFAASALRQRCQPGIGRTQIPPVLGEVRGIGRAGFHAPTCHPRLEPSGRLAGSGLLTNTIGNPLETTIALSHLIFEGTLDRFPGSRYARVMAAASCRPTPPLGRGDQDLPRPSRAITEMNPTENTCANGQPLFRYDHGSRRGHASPDRRGSGLNMW